MSIRFVDSEFPAVRMPAARARRLGSSLRSPRRDAGELSGARNLLSVSAIGEPTQASKGRCAIRLR